MGEQAWAAKVIEVADLDAAKRITAEALVLAEVDTGHFQFQALAGFEPDAREVLKDAWEVHCRDYPDADMGLMARLIEDDEVNYTLITVGGCLRDGETLL